MNMDLTLAENFYRQMLLIRRFEEKCVELYSKEKIRGFLHLYIGEEAIAVGVMHALSSDDAVFATYREHGQALARGISPKSIMAEMYGKLEGCSRGRGGSMHLFDAATRFYGGSAIVAGGLPLAVGMALADKMMKRNRVTVCFFGDGAVAEGVERDDDADLPEERDQIERQQLQRIEHHRGERWIRERQQEVGRLVAVRVPVQRAGVIQTAAPPR